MARWEYLVVPLKDAAGLRKDSEGLTPHHLNTLGSEGWEAVGVSLKQGPDRLAGRPAEACG
jgi:hypothetical protein